jgi:hypothetical protein
MKSAVAGRRVPVISILLTVGSLSACETQRQIISEREIRLPTAGFVIKLANTPDAAWPWGPRGSVDSGFGYAYGW